MADGVPSFDMLPQYVFDLVKSVEKLTAIVSELENTISIGAAQSNKPFDVNAAAEFLGLKPKTIYMLCSNRDVKHMKRSGKLYFTEADLIDYLESGRVKTKASIQAEITIASKRA